MLPHRPKLLCLGGRPAQFARSDGSRLPEKAYMRKVEDIGVRWVPRIDFIFAEGLPTQRSKSVLAFQPSGVKPNAGSSSLW